MAVRPLPRQSTMPLLQLHMAGQEPEERVQAGTRAASPWPAETVGVVSESHIAAPPPDLLLGEHRDTVCGGGSCTGAPQRCKDKQTH